MLPEVALDNDGPHSPREASSRWRLLVAIAPISSMTLGGTRAGATPQTRSQAHNLAESPLLTGFFAFLGLNFLLWSVGVIPGRACHCTIARMRIQQ